jgi:TRAP-type C4-dicarboxylate transport system permease small subunit
VTVANESPVNIHRNERILAYMIAAIVGLSILAFIAVLISSAVGVSAADYASGIWPMVLNLPLFGLPIGFVLIMVLLVLSMRRRGREARDAEQKR